MSAGRQFRDTCCFAHTLTSTLKKHKHWLRAQFTIRDVMTVYAYTLLVIIRNCNYFACRDSEKDSTTLDNIHLIVWSVLPLKISTVSFSSLLTFTLVAFFLLFFCNLFFIFLSFHLPINFLLISQTNGN